MSEREITLAQRAREAAAFGLAGLGLSTAAAFGLANHLTEHTTVGAHEGNLALTHDGHATAQNIPILGNDLRMPVQSEGNVGVRFTITKTPDLPTAIQADALIAAQPKGEQDHIKDVASSLVQRSILGGLAIGLTGAGAIYLRRETGNTYLKEAGTIVATASLTATIGLLAVPGSMTSPERSDWSPLAKQVPVLAQLHSPLVDSLQISHGVLEGDAAQLVNSGVAAYETSGAFYGPLKEKAAALGPLLHQPDKGQTVAVIISDRHDNSNMDPVVRAAADAAKATIIIDAGDDLGFSQPWEMFSLNSLFSTFKDYKYKYVANGNHDWASFVPKAFKQAHWNVLSGKPVDFPGGTKIIGEGDPRRSAVADLPSLPNSPTVSEVAEKLSTITCKEDVALAVVHSPVAAKSIAETGCTPLEIAGHQHFLEQDTVQGVYGESHVFINGTTGGPPEMVPIALWKKLHNDATIGLATFAHGKPVGIQAVIFKKSGDIQVGDYIPIPLRINTAEARPPVLMPAQFAIPFRKPQ